MEDIPESREVGDAKDSVGLRKSWTQVTEGRWGEQERIEHEMTHLPFRSWSAHVSSEQRTGGRLLSGS